MGLYKCSGNYLKRDFHVTACETYNDDTRCRDFSHMFEWTKQRMCIIQTAEGSPVVSNLLMQSSATDRLTHC